MTEPASPYPSLSKPLVVVVGNEYPVGGDDGCRDEAPRDPQVFTSAGLDVEYLYLPTEYWDWWLEDLDATQEFSVNGTEGVTDMDAAMYAAQQVLRQHHHENEHFLRLYLQVQNMRRSIHTATLEWLLTQDSLGEEFTFTLAHDDDRTLIATPYAQGQLTITDRSTGDRTTLTDADDVEKLVTGSFEKLVWTGIEYVIVEVEGGNVQAVEQTAPANTQVITIDWDNLRNPDAETMELKAEIHGLLTQLKTIRNTRALTAPDECMTFLTHTIDDLERLLANVVQEKLVQERASNEANLARLRGGEREHKGE